jgi:hypothetical protein
MLIITYISEFLMYIIQFLSLFKIIFLYCDIKIRHYIFMHLLIIHNYFLKINIVNHK